MHRSKVVIPKEGFDMMCRSNYWLSQDSGGRFSDLKFFLYNRAKGAGPLPGLLPSDRMWFCTPYFPNMSLPRISFFKTVGYAYFRVIFGRLFV